MGTCIKFLSVTPSCQEYHFSSLFIHHYIICSPRSGLGPRRHGMRDVSRVPWKYDLLDTLRAARGSKSGIKTKPLQCSWIYYYLIR